MEEGLGELGFWLAAGAVVVALTMRTWLRERDRQAFLRDMINVAAEGKVTEVLAYLREKDAADRQLQRELSGLEWFDGFKKRRSRPGAMAAVAAVAVAAAGFVGGLIAGSVMAERTESGLVPLGMMIAFWVAGGVIAWLIVRSSRRNRNDSPPVA